MKLTPEQLEELANSGPVMRHPPQPEIVHPAFIVAEEATAIVRADEVKRLVIEHVEEPDGDIVWGIAAVCADGEKAYLTASKDYGVIVERMKKLGEQLAYPLFHMRAGMVSGKITTAGDVYTPSTVGKTWQSLRSDKLCVKTNEAGEPCVDVKPADDAEAAEAVARALAEGMPDAEPVEDDPRSFWKPGCMPPACECFFCGKVFNTEAMKIEQDGAYVRTTCKECWKESGYDRVIPPTWEEPGADVKGLLDGLKKSIGGSDGTLTTIFLDKAREQLSAADYAELAAEWPAHLANGWFPRCGSLAKTFAVTDEPLAVTCPDCRRLIADEPVEKLKAKGGGDE